MVLNGGCASKEELDALDGYETALLLIDEGNGVITPYGVWMNGRTILYRYAESKGYDVSDKGDLTTFADSTGTSSWAAEAMEWAVGSGLLTGKDGGKLDPTGTATRAEIATILMRFAENEK